jgi:hypothetical protein
MLMQLAKGSIPRRAGKTGAPCVVNPSLIAHRLAVKDPRLALAGQLYARIARKLTPSINQKLVGIGEQLALQERLNPSVSSLQLQSRARTAVSSAIQTGILGADPDELALAVLVILMLVDDGDNDLQQQMANAYAMMQVKQTLRNIIQSLNNNIQQQQMTGDFEEGQQNNCSLYTDAVVSFAGIIWRK